MERIYSAEHEVAGGLADGRTGTVRARVLDEGTLLGYEQALRRAGSGVPDYWRPGLSDDEIDELEEAHGLVIPEEARRLWRWHDGISPTAPPESNEIAPGRRFLSLAVALTDYQQEAAEMRDLYGFDGLIGPFTAPPHIYFDCRGPGDAPVPIMVSHDYELPQRTLPSIGDLFATWTRFLDNGFWAMGSEGDWDFSYIDRLTDEITDLGVY
jgi:hypothetical protein